MPHKGHVLKPMHILYFTHMDEKSTNKHFQTVHFVFVQPHPCRGRLYEGSAVEVDCWTLWGGKGASRVGSLFSSATRETP